MYEIGGSLYAWMHRQAMFETKSVSTSTEVLPVRGAVIKIFYALLQAASERLPQQQEPHLVGFGISSRNMNKELPELFGMLKAAEIEIKKEHQVLMVNKTTSFKKQGKSKGKFKKGGKKAATPPMKPKNGPKPDAECYSCKEKGHWA
ncbi:hypothetical protein QYE76_054660 [Lolium multiflorum]|uniref:Uncharacterized protein n=1 Tax=Lolium multiflorum TaxID=4521 RepID=A0AAD8SZJ4_LOLMU|nr:hypothetical protein QYE76_054660 [Lolium multiflorum]